MVQAIKPRQAAAQQKYFIPVFIACFLSIVCAWVAVCDISQAPGHHALPLFLGLSLIMLTVTTFLLLYCQREEIRLPILWIILSAVILRLISLTGFPLFEDDFYRYLWDGYQTASGNDPYALAPSQYFDSDIPEVFESVLSLVNYPDIATVYGPVNQWVFALGYWIEPAAVWPLQLLTGIADILVIYVLFRLGAGNALLLYAWSPLLLKEFSLTAHPDIFAILALILGVWAVKSGRALWAGLALSLAVGAKIFALLAIPFLLSSGWPLIKWLQSGFAFVLGLTALTLSFFSVSIWVPEGLQAMADSWLFNAPIYLLLVRWFDFNNLKAILLISFSVAVILVFIRRLLKQPASNKSLGNQKWIDSPAAFRGDWLFALFLLCSPVLNPWYVAWILPFAVLFPRCWSWTASYMVLFSYWYGDYAGPGGNNTLLLPGYIVALESAVIVLLPLIVRMIPDNLLKPKRF